MALPILPILVIAGVVLFAGGKKKPKAPEQVGKGAKVKVPSVPFIPPDPQQPRVPVPGEVCSARNAGEYAAYTRDGMCAVFWDRDSPAAVSFYLKEAFDNSGFTTKDVCAPGPGWKSDPLSSNPYATSDWVPNSKQVKLLKDALAILYPGIPSNSFPPPPHEKGNMTQVQVIWGFSLGILLSDICGYKPIT